MGRDHEPDLLPLWKLKPEKILAPRTDLATGTVRFYKFSALSELNPGPGGIREPKANSGEEIAWASGDLILVPGLSFDQRGTRLGSGLGCYDRFLRSLPKGILFLAVCFDYQVSKQPLPVDSHDIPIHAICTPSGLTRISLSGEF